VPVRQWYIWMQRYRQLYLRQVNTIFRRHK
jgi:hypothetical protein